MMRIDALTQEQIDRFPEWVEKWLAIGLSCEPCDLERAKRAVVAAYGASGLPPPSQYYVFDSPVSAAIAALVLKKVGDQVGDQVRNQVGDQVRNQVGDQVGDQVRNQVWNQVLNQVGDQVWNQVGDQVGDQVRNQVRNQVGDQVWNQVGDQVYGSHDAGWLSYFDFFLSVCGLSACKPLIGLIDLAQSCGWWAPYQHVAILQHRHCELHRRADGLLHSPHGMAVKYRDGWGVYALNGVRVPGELVETTAENLDARVWVVKQTNAEIRREAVRKIGIERVCQQLGAQVIDRGQDHAGQPCELLLLNLGDDRKRPYIKLRNPSIGVYHIEGVHPDCQTLEAAFRFRNGRQGVPQWLR